MLHPNYERRSGFMRRNVFLDDFERGVGESTIEEAKKKMIDRVENGRSDYPVFVTYGEGKEQVYVIFNNCNF